MNNILKIPAFQRRKAIPKQLKDLELLPLNEQFSKLTMSIVGDDDMRPVMTGNFFDMEKKKIVSTDAHKLTAINMPNRTFDFIKQTYNKELDKDPNGLIFHTLSQLQKDYNKLMKNNNITISFDEFVKDRAIEDGRYPNYEAVIPKEFTNEINLDYQKLYWYTKVLLDAKVIDDVTKINTSNANEYQNKKIEYLKDSYTSFLNPVTKQIILTYTLDGTIQYIGFNARLLCDLLKFAMEFNGKTFGKVGLSGNSRAMVIELENGLNVINDSVGIVMPIMLVSGEFDNTIGDIDFDLSVAMYYDLDTNSIISDNKNYPIDTMVGFYPNKAGLSTPNIRVKEQVSKVENNSADLIDTRIKGYRIALKVAKAENKANIEKKIKGLEIAKKMSKFAKGGSVKKFEDLLDSFNYIQAEINYEKQKPQNEQSKLNRLYSELDVLQEEVNRSLKFDKQQANKMAKGGMVEYFDYKGVEIMYEPTYEEYFVNDMVFNTLEKAQKYIDSGEANETPTYIKNLYRRGAMAKGGSVEIERISMSRLLSEFKNEKEIFDGQIVNRGNNQFKIENDIFYIKRPNENWEVFRKIKYEDGGSVDDTIGSYTDFKNKVVITANKRQYDNSYEVIVKRYPSGENIVEYPRTINRVVFAKNYINAIGKYTDGEIGIGTFTEWIKANALDYNNLFDYAEKNNVIMPKYYDKGGIIDLFEDYENIPAEVQKILDIYSQYYGGDFSDMSYTDIRNMRTRLEEVGYIFDYGLDGVPYGLRPMNVKLSQLQGYEDEDEE